jgi:hypothetical protein
MWTAVKNAEGKFSVRRRNFPRGGGISRAAAEFPARVYFS